MIARRSPCKSERSTFFNHSNRSQDHMVLDLTTASIPAATVAIVQCFRILFLSLLKKGGWDLSPPHLLYAIFYKPCFVSGSWLVSISCFDNHPSALFQWRMLSYFRIHARPKFGLLAWGVTFPSSFPKTITHVFPELLSIMNLALCSAS